MANQYGGNNRSFSTQPTTANSLLSGYLFGLPLFGWPLVIGGALKDIDDMLLLMFKAVKAPEGQDEKLSEKGREERFTCGNSHRTPSARCFVVKPGLSVKET